MTEENRSTEGWDGWEARGIEDSQLSNTVFRRHRDENSHDESVPPRSGGSAPDGVTDTSGSQ